MIETPSTVMGCRLLSNRAMILFILVWFCAVRQGRSGPVSFRVRVTLTIDLFYKYLNIDMKPHARHFYGSE